MSRMLKNIGLFCKRDLQKRPIFCKETYIFKHPTNRSHLSPLPGSAAAGQNVWSQKSALNSCPKSRLQSYVVWGGYGQLDR